LSVVQYFDPARFSKVECDIVKTFFEQLMPSLIAVSMVVAGLAFFNCSGTPGREPVSAADLGRIGRLDVSELTPAEVDRLNDVINREVSPCANNYSLAETILNPDLCPLTPMATAYVIDLLKQDYSADEIAQKYVARYATVKGLDIPAGDSPRTGAENPSVRIVVFSDFACPFCSKAAVEVKRVASLWPDRVQVLFKHFPLQDIHPDALLGARAGYAAHQQGKFWEMHDTLFSRSGVGFTPDTVRTIAVGLGMDADRFDDDVASDDAMEVVKRDMDLGRRLGVDGTPKIFVNGRVLDGGLSGLEARVTEEFLRERFTAR